MLDVSNARPIGILAGYLTTCALLAVTIIRTIYHKAASSKLTSRHRHAIIIFSALAVLSLATTWYHMFRFFQWSYQQWESTHLENPDGELHLGQWLRDTTLFKQAWVSTLEKGPRAFWSMQIFGFCANWSVMLAWQGKTTKQKFGLVLTDAADTKKRIPHLWIFMLLGQIVAISFAVNLSFLAFLVFEDVDTSSKATEKEKTIQSSPNYNPMLRTSWLAVLIVTIGCALAIPFTLNHPNFMYLLLAPHVLAFAPLLFNKLVGVQKGAAMDEQPTRDNRARVRAIVVTVALCHLLWRGDWGDAMSALYEHPAVSSVGWDVICCWITFSVWYFVRYGINFEKKYGFPRFSRSSDERLVQAFLSDTRRSGRKPTSSAEAAHSLEKSA
ncbi:alpha-mannosyltransferase alg11p [Fusarium longipes]|uniref:Alpha-mannosyltransferase alg11p n=1 Tax=Fusarium longipes TaxID=694270 RepID=A0A395SXQ0_9HYPO|nr:alpha-mannosyltransferase alg11p [Fusarium longipes]